MSLSRNPLQHRDLGELRAAMRPHRDETWKAFVTSRANEVSAALDDVWYPAFNFRKLESPQGSASHVSQFTTVDLLRSAVPFGTPDRKVRTPAATRAPRAHPLTMS